jgi:hypothetical protein
VTATTDESDDWNVDVSYDMGNGISVFVGADDAGGGASLLASYTDDSDDEVSAKDYKEGMTLQLSFAF